MLEITKDTDVYTANDEHVGSVDQIVLDPDSGKLTHIVVRKGIFFPEDKLIAFGDISTATPERINLRQEVEAGELLPFIEQHYAPVDEVDRPVALAPSDPAYLATWYGPMAIVPTADTPPLEEIRERNIPDRLTALGTGHPVFSSDRKAVGELERVVTTDAGLPTHFVVGSTGLSIDRRAVPVDWVQDISEDAIQLAATERQVEAIVPLGPDE